MAEREMNESERVARDAANKIFADLFRGITGPSSRRSDFIYWEAPDQRRFCYTPWKDSNGDYFTWVMKPYGRGAKSGDAKNWKRVGKVVRSRTRKTARKRAHTRHKNWNAYLNQEWRNE